MAFTYGFYNYDKNDAEAKLYDAKQMSQLFDGLITDGVYRFYGNRFRVYAPSDQTANTVIIDTGRAWFNHTWCYNDSNYIFIAPAPPSFNSRIDALVLDINSGTRINSFAWVMGEESATPSRPALTNTETQHQHAIAYVTRTANVSVITSNDITYVVGTAETPYVVGIVNEPDVNIDSVTFESDGTASAASVRAQYLTVDGDHTGVVSGSMYMKQSKTLSTSTDTTYTFTNSIILSTSTIDVFASQNMNYSDISINGTNHTCSVTYPKQDTQSTMEVKIYIRND